MSNKIKILGFAGSIRKKSYNRALLNSLLELAPENMEIELYDISDIPLYNGDIEDSGTPESVLKFKNKINEADGVIIATPEYNHSISGILKNLLDWISRKPLTPFSGKPVGIIGATPGKSGTAFSQEYLKHIGGLLNMHIMNRPSILISKADDIFDENLKLMDEVTKVNISKFLSAFEEWVKLLKK